MIADRGAKGKDISARLKPERSTLPLSWLTVEVALYILIGMIAAGLRFYALGAQPLQESEAAQALSAWRFLGIGNWELGIDVGYSPFLFLGNVFTFFLLGASNALARWVPALSGTLLSILPYFLRRRLGRSAALFASILLALSPSTLWGDRLSSLPAFWLCWLASSAIWIASSRNMPI
jgi:predicted membrane-bound mannosyltransferase